VSGVSPAHIIAAMKPSPPQSVVIVTHPHADEAEELLSAIREFLEAQSVEVVATTIAEDAPQETALTNPADMIVAVGGDGTMLRAGSLGAQTATPVLGINLGRLGFLVEVGREGWHAAMQRVLAGDFWLESRMCLHAELYREGSKVGAWNALNECVVGRGDVARPIRLTAEVDERTLTHYVADAMICATATGSTAYALAAGGPILPPELRNLVLVPVAPHLSLDRAIVLPEGSKVRIGLEADQKASFGVDGQDSVAMLGGDEIRVRSAEHDVLFVRLQDRGYFFRNLTTHMNHFPQ
jgi:NAD+ kinase